MTDKQLDRLLNDMYSDKYTKVSEKRYERYTRAYRNPTVRIEDKPSNVVKVDFKRKIVIKEV